MESHQWSTYPHPGRSHSRSYQRGLVAHTLTQYGDVVVYHVHDLAYSYARAHIQFEPEYVIQACRHYALLYTHDLDALDAERVNLLSAASLAYQHADGECLLAIVNALVVEGPYVKARGYDSLLLEQIDRAIDFA